MFRRYALDALDVPIYAIAIPVLIGIGFVASSEAGLIATNTLVLSAVGGWGAGILADRLGRVRTLLLTVLWFAVLTAACGLVFVAALLLPETKGRPLFDYRAMLAARGTPVAARQSAS